MKKPFFALLLLLSLGLVITGCSDRPTQEGQTFVAMGSQEPFDSSADNTRREDNSVELKTTISDSESEFAANGQLLVTMDFARGGTPASNQYAVWVEDNAGNLVKTIYVSDFTAMGGYEYREDAIPTWVTKAKPGEMDASAVDAISSATPQSGSQRYSWDGTDENGDAVPSGDYHIFIEGTLYWTSSVLYSGSFEWGGDSATIEMTSVYTEADNETNRDMITQVSAEYNIER